MLLPGVEDTVRPPWFSSTVFLTGDDPAWIETIQGVLEASGLCVIACNRPAALLDSAQLASADLIVLQNGHDSALQQALCSELKADSRTSASSILLVVPAGCDDAQIVAALDAGADDYIHINASGELFCRKVKRLILQSSGNNGSRRRGERKRTMQQLRLQAAALESTANGIIIADRDGIIKWVNPAFTSLTGYAPEEVIGRNPRILKSNHHDSDFYKNLWNTVLAGRVWSGRITNRRKDGSLYTEEMTITPVRNLSGEIANFIAIKQDITEREHLENQLHQSQKMEAIGRLAGGVAHDFNNLLTAIIGYSQLMLSRLNDSDPLRSNAEEIDKAGRRAAALTSQLLAFSRKQVLQPKVLDINNIIADMERMLRRLIGEDIDVVTILRPNLHRVKADPGQMEQVIMNIAVNARDAMPRGGKLTIETANVALDGEYIQCHPVKPGRYIMLAISDNGCGMDEATLSHIFEPFFTTKEKGKGTGLGLSTVYGIIKQSGGYIWAYSEIGRGTAFKIYLPSMYLPAVGGEVGDPAVSVERRSLPQGTETILLVEDDMAVRELAARVLREQGYTVLEAADGLEGLERARLELDGISLVLTDVVTPRIGGRQMANELILLRDDLKVLYMSGYTDDAIVHHGALDPDVAFLQKPFTPDALVRKVRMVIDEKKSEARSQESEG